VQEEKKSLVVRLVEALTHQSFEQAVGERREAGKSYRQIGAEFGLTHVAIWQEWQKRGRVRRGAGRARSGRMDERACL
jgi:hypothetical protein